MVPLMHVFCSRLCKRKTVLVFSGLLQIVPVSHDLKQRLYSGGITAFLQLPIVLDLFQYIGTMDVPRPSSRVEIVAAMRKIRVGIVPLFILTRGQLTPK